jgi:DNA-binding protein HU-beta
MNKSQLIDTMARNEGVSKASAKKCVDAFIDIATKTLRSGEKLAISGFGSFIVAKNPARVGRNFKTGTAIDIPERSIIKFRPSIEVDY